MSGAVQTYVQYMSSVRGKTNYIPDIDSGSNYVDSPLILIYVSWGKCYGTKPSALVFFIVRKCTVNQLIWGAEIGIFNGLGREY
jgi:hypothetical protein